MSTTLISRTYAPGHRQVKIPSDHSHKHFKVLQGVNTGVGPLARRLSEGAACRVQAAGGVSNFGRAKLDVKTAAVGLHGGQSDAPALAIADTLHQ